MGIVKELYEGNGACGDVKFVLTINEDDTVKLVYFNGSVRFEEPNPRIVDIGKNGGKTVEYGTSFSKTSLPFRKYDDGTLDKRWTRIK